MDGAFAFLSKAATLSGLEDKLGCARVLPQATIALAAWRRDRGGELDRVATRPWVGPDVRGTSLIVRSSARNEDGRTASHAGRYTTVQEVQGRDQLSTAIDAVFASYGEDTEGEVLIQPMVQRPIASGVVTSREVGAGRPYIVISTSQGADTTAVTGGRSNESRVYYQFRGLAALPAGPDGLVIAMLREVEALTGEANLDLEFAFAEGEGLPILLQARPLVDARSAGVAQDRQARQLATAEAKVSVVLGRHPLARGRRSALGCMTDWNPAEMIGVRPRPLALSLYRSLITDAVWSHQRRTYGYRDLGGFPLMIDLLGAPFIDVRASFESFVPAALEDVAAERLVDLYMDRLIAAPALHDKVEFEIVLSCYAFDIDERLAGLRAEGLPPGDAQSLRRALHALTARVLAPHQGPRHDDRAALHTLVVRRGQIRGSNLDPLASAYWLLEDCRRFGTRPFAGLARAGFIAMEMMNSLVATGVIDDADRRAFLMSLATVTTRMQRDLESLSRQRFLDLYGHLRPGAYDIRSPRYDEAPTQYFDRPGVPAPWRSATAAAGEAEAVRARIEPALAPVLRAHDIGLGADQFLDFVAEGVRGREEAKFLFTRNLSDALACLTRWGQGVGLSVEDLSFGDARVVDQCVASTRNPVDLFRDAIREGRESYGLTEATCLPPLILRPEDVWAFVVPPATPTFVTSGRAVGPVVTDLDRRQLAGAVVLVPSADPGFDWIFAHGVAGLVTAYGGANSHMAIRAAELDLPAVIGAGEQTFKTWAQAPALAIDCANRRVDPIFS
jgi:phosphohistidine swiveling domain-containing protein